MASTTGKNGKAHVFEISNRVLIQEINGTTLNSVSNTLNTHTASGNTAAHLISNITGLQLALDGKQDEGGNNIVWDTTNTTGKFYTGTTTPTGSTRINYSGYFYPTYINLSGSGDTTTAATHYFVETGSDGFVRPKTLANARDEIRNGPGALGYTAGAGGTIPQSTSRTTNVTLSDYCGNITLFSTTTTAGQTTVFTVTNTLIASTDNIILNHISGGNLGQYEFRFTPANGSFTVTCYTAVAQTVAAAPVLRFTIIKGVTA